MLLALAMIVGGSALATGYDAKLALEKSQAAIGNRFDDVALTDRDGKEFRFASLAGKPAILSMIFTSCHHICPMTTRNLATAVRAARDALGAGSFTVVTIGFDTPNDTPEAMREFAREQGVDLADWYFLSASEETIANISAATGFQFFPTARGFDHINQLTIVDRQTTVYRQVYGVDFELPALVEPLKQLVFDRPEAQGHPLTRLADRVRLFCTVYNPATGRYEIDNSLFIQTAIGFLVIVSAVVFLWRGMRGTNRRMTD